MEALGLPVPKPIAAEKDPAHLGCGFIIVAEVVDSTRAGDLFPELNDMTKFDASFAPDLARALARLHSLPNTRKALISAVIMRRLTPWTWCATFKGCGTASRTTPRCR
jgi:aminoglycoside phosphotransferase (APT) family kinase protein